MRGQLDKTYPAPLRLRIIPARAGPTRPPSTSRSLKPDHPRSCGANFTPVETGSTPAGSSPLVRGQPELVLDPVERVRIIPARAGPTGRRSCRWSWRADHPRSCGANADQRMAVDDMNGSSPLVRGQPPAGLSAISPRGSSPLVRGQRWRHQYRSVHERIIPARAGPTSWLRWSRRVKPDHPRSCGANAHGLAPFVSRSGSSPLVRGQRSGMRLNRLTRRIIPARAGPTYSKRMTKTTATDHPRSCGANA